MPSRELQRLGRLNLDSLNEARLRTELSRAIERFNVEFETLENERNEIRRKLQDSTIALAEYKTRFDELDAVYKTEIETVAQLKAENAQLRDAVASASSSTDKAASVSPELIEKIQVLEFDRSSALARLRATEALLEKIQKEHEVGRKTQQVVPTTEIFQSFAKDMADAEIPAGFEIDDVEVEVRGALGTRDNKVVMGLDATRLMGSESVTSMRFTLRRAATVKKLE